MSEFQQAYCMLIRIGAPMWVVSDPVTKTTCIHLEAKRREDEPVCGYAGFCTIWTFTCNGELLNIGIWE